MDPTLAAACVAGAVAIVTAAFGIGLSNRGRSEEKQQDDTFRSLEEWRRNETSRADRAELARDRESLRADRAEAELEDRRRRRNP